VRQILQQAQQALQRGAYQEVDRLAKRSLRVQKTRRAYALMAMAQCGLKSLRLAKAWYNQVGPRYRRQVRRFCKSHDIDVAP
jgi:thioredoxin-like negative regulator of GroEL